MKRGKQLEEEQGNDCHFPGTGSIYVYYGIPVSNLPYGRDEFL